MRRALTLAVVGVALGVPGLARAEGEAVTLEAGRPVALHGSKVKLTGRVVPATANVGVDLLRVVGGSAQLVARLETNENGRFRIVKDLRRPGPFFARATFPAGGGDPVVVESARANVAIKPRLSAAIAGTRTVGHHLYVKGRLRPVAAGKLVRKLRGETHRVRLGRSGAFTVRLPTRQPKAIWARLQVKPAKGYRTRGRTVHTKLALPSLATGSQGLSVRALERLLKKRQYALRNVNTSYGIDTMQAVLAFQKVHGLSRTGRVTPSIWRKLGRSKTPKARVPRGDHIEISKSDQTLYEVRDGKVVNVLHTSTGATGNTPVGTWRVYSKVAGYNAVHMYYSLFFLRGFAIHGYHSVPPWPASHGCARLPLWSAPGLFSRWDYGSKIIVFA